MITPITLLLDLDDTLLDSNMEGFIPVYFQSLSEYLSDQVEPEILLPALVAGTRSMMANQDPACTLRQVFDERFFPAIGKSREEMQPRIDQFYRERFPDLKHLTARRPAAIPFVEWAFDRGHRMAVATNPLFPRAAIHHRMEWAGLPADAYPFQIVSSYEDFHFAKPNPAYFAEVLARMGWPQGPVLMVGDDPENDVAGARALGLGSFWVTPDGSSGEEIPGILGSGPIENLRPWLEAITLEEVDFSRFSLESILVVLQATPAALDGFSGSLHGQDVRQRPIQGEWSLTEILCHMRDTEMESNLVRIRAVLDQDNPFLPAQESHAWATGRSYNQQPFGETLAQFTSSRKAVLEILRGLTEREWSRVGRHAIFGPSTLQDLVRFMAEHDALHLRQAMETAARLYS